MPTTPLLPKLTGVRLVGKPSLISETEAITYSTPKVVASEGFTKAPPPDEAVLAAAEPFLGKPVSLASLKELTDAMIDAYRATDYPLVDIYLPPQNVTTGVIQFVVIEATLGEISVDGAKYSNADFLIRQMNVEPGDRINRRVVEEDLEYLNENPFRRVDLIYKRGEAERTSDIVLKTEDAKPWRVYTEWGNTGTDLTGENEWSSGFTWGQIGGTEMLLSYNYTTDVSFDNLHAHSLFYQWPLENRDTLQILGAYVESEGNVATQNGPLGVSGENIQLSGEYHFRLKPAMRRSSHRMVAAIDYKSTDNDLLFGGNLLANQPAEIFQFRFGYEFRLRDNLGYTEVEFYHIHSPGDVLAKNTDANFQLLRAGATADYDYATAKIERVTQLPRHFILRNQATFQYTDQPLLSTEQLLAGGYRTLRGLPENAIRGDRGISLQTELLAPEIEIFPNVDDHFQPFLFTDAAHFKTIAAPGTGPDTHINAFTAGVGLNLRIGNYLNARASYGWVLNDDGLAPGLDSGRFHIGVSASY